MGRPGIVCMLDWSCVAINLASKRQNNPDYSDGYHFLPFSDIFTPLHQNILWGTKSAANPSPRSNVSGSFSFYFARFHSQCSGSMSKDII